MTHTITIDSNTHTWRDGSLYVLEQQGLDVLQSVTWEAVSEVDASFSSAMRADYILIHDREVGVLIPHRAAHAWYRTGHGRHRDTFGNTQLTAPVKGLVERNTAAAELVNIVYLAAPTRRNLPALARITVSDATLTQHPTVWSLSPERKWFDIDLTNPGTMEEQEQAAIAEFDKQSIEDKLEYLETGHDTMHFYAIRRSFIEDHSDRPY